MPTSHVSKNPEIFSPADGHIYLWDLEPDALRLAAPDRNGRPRYARLRRIVSSAFTPRKVKDYAAYTRDIARGLLDEAVAKESFDWVEGASRSAADQRDRQHPRNLPARTQR